MRCEDEKVTTRTGSAWQGLGTRACWRAPIAAVLLLAAAASGIEPVTYNDAIGDALIRRTDLGGDAPLDPLIHRLPDLIEMRVGRFAPVEPWVDRFAGAWDPEGGFLRLDIVLLGLINPPGPVGYGASGEYDPYRYGPHPVCGYVEMDVDANVQTGGELDFPEQRYLGVVGRWGGLPSAPWHVGRAALSPLDFDHNVQSPPYVDRSGEEFHLVLRGEMLATYAVVTEAPGGDPVLFEAGETWILQGTFLHRAHGFSPYAQLQCGSENGEYMPQVWLRFAHSAADDRTTVTLVYPLQNAGAALLIAPTEPVEAMDGCAWNQNSVLEALDDLRYNATYTLEPWRSQPEFQLIAGWEFQDPAAFLNPPTWRLNACLGTAFAQLEDGFDRYCWTDVWPNVVSGDFNADGVANGQDHAQASWFLYKFDGVEGVDLDGSASNGSVQIVDYARSFFVYDVNYDGYVDALDLIRPGDMDLNQVTDIEDVDDFVLALIDPEAYAATHGGLDPLPRGDLNGDGLLDGGDVPLFVNLLIGSP